MVILGFPSVSQLLKTSLLAKLCNNLLLDLEMSFILLLIWFCPSHVTKLSSWFRMNVLVFHCIAFLNIIGSIPIFLLKLFSRRLLDLGASLAFVFISWWLFQWTVGRIRFISSREWSALVFAFTKSFSCSFISSCGFRWAFSSISLLIKALSDLRSFTRCLPRWLQVILKFFWSIFPVWNIFIWWFSGNLKIFFR